MHRKQLFRPFWDMVYKGVPDFGCDDFEALDALVPGRGRASLLLGCYGEAEIRERLEFYSVNERLRDLGFPDYDVHIDATEPEHQALTLYPVVGGRRLQEPLAELILREALLTPDQTLIEATRPFGFLVIQWIRLQNPLVEAAPDALLPGQRFPGLGLGKKVMEMLITLTRRRRLDGIINRPEFLHNALLYAPHFRFLNPAVEGRLRALQRDLDGLSLWDIAWAAHRGYVVEDECRNFFRWYQSEQIWPECEELRRYLESERYDAAMREAMDRAGYRVAIPEDAAP